MRGGGSGARAASLSRSAHGPAAATSRISRCVGSARLSGICTARHAARRQRREDLRQLLEMIGHPLIDGVGEDQIRARLRRSRSSASASSNCALRQALARLVEHRGRAVEPDELGVGLALGQQLGGVARPAAHVDDAAQRRRAAPAPADRAPGASAHPRSACRARATSQPFAELARAADGWHASRPRSRALVKRRRQASRTCWRKLIDDRSAGVHLTAPRRPRHPRHLLLDLWELEWINVFPLKIRSRCWPRP